MDAVVVSPWLWAVNADVEQCMVVYHGWSHIATVSRLELGRQASDAQRMVLRAERIAQTLARIQACLAAGGPYGRFDHHSEKGRLYGDPSDGCRT